MLSYPLSLSLYCTHMYKEHKITITTYTLHIIPAQYMDDILCQHMCVGVSLVVSGGVGVTTTERGISLPCPACASTSCMVGWARVTHQRRQ